MVKCKALTGSAVKGLNFCTAQVTTMKFTYARRQINAGAKPKKQGFRNRGDRCVVWKIRAWFSTNIWRYVGNDARIQI